MDPHGSALWGQIEKLDHVLVSKPNATVAGRSSNGILIIGSVNVDVSLPSVCVDGVEPVEPENAG